MRKKVDSGKKQTGRGSDPQEQTLIQRIKSLHSEIMGFYKKSLEAGITIGGLLNTKRQEVGHSHWLPWVKENLPFCDRSASNYMKLYKNRERLRKEQVPDLQTAYKLLSDPDKYGRHNRRMATIKNRKKCADRKIKYVNPNKYENSVHCGDNFALMQKLIADGMVGKYSGVVTSNPYNSGFYYGKDFNDEKPYKEYLEDTLRLFPLYTRLLRPGGRIVYVTANIVRNKNRDEGGDYNLHLLPI